MQTTTVPRFNELVEQYYQPLFRFAASLCGSPEAALTLTQNTFRTARPRVDQPVPAANVKPWLFTLLFLQFLETRPDVAAEAGRADAS